MLASGIGLVLLVGLAAFFFFGRSDGTPDGDQQAGLGGDTTPDANADGVGGLGETGTDVTPDPNATPEQPAPTGEPPTIRFDEAAMGPVNADTPYSLTLTTVPVGATGYQLIVDDVPQGEPAAEIPQVTFTPGKHLLKVDTITPTGIVSSTAVIVYAISAVPAAVTYRANLASVNIDPNVEGWGQAITRFDAFVAAGHTELQLMPSDFFPGLTPGYWNLYIGGFASTAEATAYCEQFSLGPDDCFAIEVAPPAG